VSHCQYFRTELNFLRRDEKIGLMCPTLALSQAISEESMEVNDPLSWDNHMLRCLKQRLKQLKQSPTRIHRLTKKTTILKEKWGSKHIHWDDGQCGQGLAIESNGWSFAWTINVGVWSQNGQIQKKAVKFLGCDKKPYLLMVKGVEKWIDDTHENQVGRILETHWDWE
jgi:hypothetical protein